ncbi:nuclear transport factor 2 family protein [Pararhizobium arenae]|uniref:nuclear transport factor 2 family protein n=1 Tax=Pararhizobium arenae TaxID=1856850 RepID=UPI00094AAF6B|nr:nuclear transport factor 2 family protein [Pararhizobium arenae]
MSNAQAMERIVRDIYIARDSGDVDGILTHIEAGCSFRIVGGPMLGALSQGCCGPDSIRCAMQGLVDHWDTTKVDVVHISISGDTVFAHRAGKVRFIPDDIEFETEIADKFVFRDGRVVEVLEFIDTLTMAEHVGLLKQTA